MSRVLNRGMLNRGVQKRSVLNREACAEGGKGAVEAIDCRAHESAESVQKMHCVRFGMHTSCREVHKFRQPRFEAAGGRAAFIAAHCQECV